MEFPHNFNEIEFDESGSVIRKPEKEIKKFPLKKMEKKSDENDEEIKALEAEIAFLKKNEQDLGWRDRERLQALEDRLTKAKEGGTDALVM